MEVQQSQNGTRDLVLDLGMRSEFMGYEISIGTAAFHSAPPVGGFLVFTTTERNGLGSGGRITDPEPLPRPPPALC